MKVGTERTQQILTLQELSLLNSRKGEGFRDSASNAILISGTVCILEDWNEEEQPILGRLDLTDRAHLVCMPKYGQRNQGCRKQELFKGIPQP